MTNYNVASSSEMQCRGKGFCAAVASDDLVLAFEGKEVSYGPPGRSLKP